ncbi:hypothetical protein DICVIV_04463 [Dictyocaulus viviparus]|uniref:Uncharacterized protein n=1 Tax=Dictyocaulus viviparus TaxID=29172 RepID=A0A0D8XY10_DICVI|nr:hypothetical protein DICVIV_04463 [Dictyocaulus viviparus]
MVSSVLSNKLAFCLRSAVFKSYIKIERYAMPKRYVSVMMGFLSTIRGKRELPVIGSVDVGPLANKSKKLVIHEWPRLAALSRL